MAIAMAWLARARFGNGMVGNGSLWQWQGKQGQQWQWQWQGQGQDMAMTMAWQWRLSLCNIWGKYFVFDQILFECLNMIYCKFEIFGDFRSKHWNTGVLNLITMLFQIVENMWCNVLSRESISMLIWSELMKFHSVWVWSNKPLLSQIYRVSEDKIQITFWCWDKGPLFT